MKRKSNPLKRKDNASTNLASHFAKSFKLKEAENADAATTSGDSAIRSCPDLGVDIRRKSLESRRRAQRGSSLNDLSSHFAKTGILEEAEDVVVATSRRETRFRSCPDFEATNFQQTMLGSRQGGRCGKRCPRVSFGAVEVREFERVLDVHPSCSSGPSLSIGWKYEPKDIVKVDHWEKSKRKLSSSSGGKGANVPLVLPGCSSGLKLSQEMRERIAKKFGYTDEDIAKNSRKIERAQIRRRKSLEEEEREFSSDPKSLMAQLYRARRKHSVTTPRDSTWFSKVSSISH